MNELEDDWLLNLIEIKVYDDFLECVGLTRIILIVIDNMLL